MKMSNNSSDSVKDSDHLNLIALEYVQGIDENAHLHPCLPQGIVENISTDTALKALDRPLPSVDERSEVQVYELYFLWYLCGF